MFFDTWTGVLRILLIGPLAYVGLVFLLRASGKRTLSKLNAFDLVVTVALGSTLATILLSRDVPLAEGLLALALLIFLQFAITSASVRSQTVSRLVRSEPTLLFHKGNFLQNVMKAERIKEGEILQAMRSQGISQFKNVAAIVLETDGSLSILETEPDAGSSTLSGVDRARNI